MLITVLRQEVNDSEILGSVRIDGRLFCWSLELPWRDNRAGISCIPEGLYRCEKYTSPKHGKTKWAVLLVPNRSGIILAEVGNTCRDIQGCIAFGSAPGWLEGKRAVTGSISTVEAFENAVEYETTLTLEIWSTRL